MAYSTLQYDIEDRILTLTLNRPEVLNAFSVTMAEELVQARLTVLGDARGV